MPVELSIIVPVYNEAANILPLAKEVAVALRESELAHELVFVDDASTDETWRQIAAAQSQNNSVRGLRLARNSGQSAALWTGLQATSSPVVATLDGDLQNDPADLPRLLAELERYDLVCGVRLARKDSSLRRISSAIARGARKAVLGVDFSDSGCSLRVFKRSALAGVFPFNGLHRFLPILIHGNGAKWIEIPVNHRPRVAGVSKYGLWNRLGRGIVDLLAIAWYQKRRWQAVPYEESHSPVKSTR